MTAIIQFSGGVRDAMNDTFESTIGTAPLLRLLSGSMPANCAASETGTLCCEITLPSDWMAASSGGTKAKSGTWSGTGDAGAGAGTDVGYGRVYDSTGTTCHFQGNVSVTPGGAWAASTAYTAGNLVSNGGNVYVCTTGGTSAGSGGPTGTGTGITDNTAVWDYVSPLGAITMDNISVASAQAVTVNTFSLTAPGA